MQNRSKLVLYIGVILLTVGILLRIFTSYTYLPFVIIGSGSLCKIYYISKLISRGAYKFGYELLFLVVGLILFFTGMYLRSNYQSQIFLLFMGAGLVLKSAFIILFIQKMRQRKS